MNTTPDPIPPPPRPDLWRVERNHCGAVIGVMSPSSALADFLASVLHEEIDRDFAVDVMPMEGNSARNSGGVRLVLCPEKDWPSSTLARMGCKRVVYRLRSTPELEAVRASSWRARSFIYHAPNDLAADLATFGVTDRRIDIILDECRPYWPSGKALTQQGADHQRSKGDSSHEQH